MNAMVKDAARREIRAALHRAGSAAELGQLSDAELLQLIRQSPIPSQLVGEVRAARTERRRELVARRERETTAIERDGAALQRKCAAADAAVATKRAELEAAQRAAFNAHGERADRDNQLRARLAINAAELEHLAPPAIDAFIARMNAEHERMHLGGNIELVGAHIGDQAAADRNAERSLQMEGLQAASSEAEKLKLTALDGEELEAALAKIEANMLELAKAARAARGQK